MTVPETVLFVIDVQNGFIRDTTSAPVVEPIAAYLRAW
jgi:nicotinamidase-related amidase